MNRQPPQNGPVSNELTGWRRILPLPDITALKLRDYRLWWVASSVTMLNQFGTQMILSWWVQTELDSPARVGAMILFFGLPSVLFVLPAGIVADRWDRRKQLMTAQSAALCSAFLLGLLMLLDVVTYEIAAVFAFASGTTVAFSQPARQSLIPMMVPRRLLQNGVVLGSLSMNVSRMVAPMIATALIAVIAVYAALFFVAALLLVGVIAVKLMRIPEFPAETTEAAVPAGAPGADGAAAQPTGPPRSPQPGASGRPAAGPSGPASLTGGFHFLLESRPLLVLMVLFMATGLFIVGPMQTMIPVLVDQEWNQNADSLGVAFTIQAVTGFVTGLYLTRMGSMRNKGAFFACAMMGGASSFLLFSISPEFLVALVFFGTFGIAASFYSNMSQTILQSNTPRELMGRVLSIYQLSVQGLLPLGALLGGLVAEVLGAPLTGLIGGAIGLTLATTALLFARNFRQLS